MANLSLCLRYYIADRLNNDPGWKNIKVLYNLRCMCNSLCFIFMQNLVPATNDIHSSSSSSRTFVCLCYLGSRELLLLHWHDSSASVPGSSTTHILTLTLLWFKVNQTFKCMIFTVFSAT